jgi:hypothetical protein
LHRGRGCNRVFPLLRTVPSCHIESVTQLPAPVPKLRPFPLLRAILAAAFFISLAGCHHDPSPTGIDALPGGDLIGVKSFDTRQANATVTATTFTHPVAGSAALYLSVGRTAQYESRTLLRWFEFPYTIADSGRIVSARIRLFASPYGINNSSSPVSFDVKAILSSWSSYTFTSDSLATMQVDPLTRGSYTGPMADSIDVAIDSSLARSWLRLMAGDDFADIRGVMLEPAPGSSAIHAFESIDARTYGGSLNSRGPQLLITMNFGGADTTFVAASLEDACVTRALQAPTASVAVLGGVTWRSAVTFDISGIPAGSIINSASLYLTKNLTASHTGYRGVDSVLVYELPSANHDSLATTYSLAQPSGTTDQLIATGYPLIRAVQRWVNDTGRNFGLLLVRYSEVTDIDYLEFYGPEAAADKRPRLVITYTERP